MNNLDIENPNIFPKAETILMAVRARKDRKIWAILQEDNSSFNIYPPLLSLTMKMSKK